MARREEIAREWKRIVRAEIERGANLPGHTVDDAEIEVVPIVGDDHIVAAKGTKLRPHGLEARLVGQFRLANAMCGECTGRYASARLHQPAELLHDRAVAHAYGGDLDDLRLRGVVVRRLEIERREAGERRRRVVHLEQLRRLEHTECQPD